MFSAAVIASARSCTAAVLRVVAWVMFIRASPATERMASAIIISISVNPLSGLETGPRMDQPRAVRSIRPAACQSSSISAPSSANRRKRKGSVMPAGSNQIAG